MFRERFGKNSFGNPFHAFTTLYLGVGFPICLHCVCVCVFVFLLRFQSRTMASVSDRSDWGWCRYADFIQSFITFVQTKFREQDAAYALGSFKVLMGELKDESSSIANSELIASGVGHPDLMEVIDQFLAKLFPMESINAAFSKDFAIANEYFRRAQQAMDSNKLPHCVHLLSGALRYVPSKVDDQLNTEQKEACEKLTAAIYHDRCLAFAMLEQYSDAILDAKEAMKHNHPSKTLIDAVRNLSQSESESQSSKGTSSLLFMFI